MKSEDVGQTDKGTDNYSEQDFGQVKDTALVQKIKNELDSSCDAMDGYTLSRLNQIRHKALEEGLAKRGRRQGRRGVQSFLLPFGGLATACVLVLTVSLYNQSGVSYDPAPGFSAIEDIELLSSAESLEFYEDYEFYQWLAENETAI